MKKDSPQGNTSKGKRTSRLGGKSKGKPIQLVNFKIDPEVR